MRTGNEDQTEDQDPVEAFAADLERTEPIVKQEIIPPSRVDKVARIVAQTIPEGLRAEGERCLRLVLDGRADEVPQSMRLQVALALAKAELSLPPDWQSVGRRSRYDGMTIDDVRENLRPPLRATKFDPDKWQNVPMREWLYGDHYIRDYVTGTSAPTKQGKSTIVMVEAVSMMTNFDLLGVGAKRMPPKRLKVWLWNGEDPEEELVRRLKAICAYYGRKLRDDDEDEPTHPRFDFTFEDLRDYLYLDSGRDTPIKIAKIENGAVNIAVPVVQEMTATINGEGIDVAVIDPLITAHHIPERSEAMDQVIGAFKDVAYRTHSAIEHVQHTRKLGRGVEEVTSDDSRGSTTILAAWRDSRVVNVMDSETAKASGVGNRFRFLRLESDRGNMVANGEGARWCYLESVNLYNGPNGSEGDDVGVAVPWTPPSKSEGQKAADAIRILGAVLKLIDDGKRITKQTGGDYTIKTLVGYLKRNESINATRDEIERVLLEASEGPDATIEYNSDTKRGTAGYRRIAKAAGNPTA